MRSDSIHSLKVFICYSVEDTLAVRALYADLIIDGFDAWLAEEKLIAGQNWEMEIYNAERAADTIVICMSQKSVTKEGYIQKEIRRALEFSQEKPEGRIYLIPAKLEPCDTPYLLKHLQWVDLFMSDGYLKLKSALEERSRFLELALNTETSSKKQVGGNAHYQVSKKVRRFAYRAIESLIEKLGYSSSLSPMKMVIADKLGLLGEATKDKEEGDNDLFFRYIEKEILFKLNSESFILSKEEWIIFLEITANIVKDSNDLFVLIQYYQLDELAIPILELQDLCNGLHDAFSEGEKIGERNLFAQYIKSLHPTWSQEENDKTHPLNTQSDAFPLSGVLKTQLKYIIRKCMKLYKLAKPIEKQ